MGKQTDPGAEIGAGAPVSAAERITAIDTLRGVAVLGILVMNIYAFAMPFQAYMNPLPMGGTEWYNLGTWFFTHILFDQKFLTIFALLFGAGLVIMWERAEQRGAKPGRTWYRRQFWLLVIGAIHGYLIWWGDILFHYALMGMFVYLFRKWRPMNLVILACCMLPVALVFSYGGSYYMEDLRAQAADFSALAEAGEALNEEQQQILEQWEAMRPFMDPTPEALQKDIDTHLGGYTGIVAYRAPTVLSMQLQNTFAFAIWRIAGLMILGMAFMKLGILSGQRDAGFYRRMALLGYGLGLPIMVFSAANSWAHGFEPLYMFRIGMAPNYVGSILVSFGHIALVMLIVNSGAMSRLMARFAAVGRMALSNYLMHSVVMTTVFYGYGLGLYGSVPRMAQMGFVVAMIGFQLWFSPLWLSGHRFGPAEWLWRSLTYGRRQPMRRLLGSE